MKKRMMNKRKDPTVNTYVSAFQILTFYDMLNYMEDDR